MASFAELIKHHAVRSGTDVVISSGTDTLTRDDVTLDQFDASDFVQ